MFLFCTIPGSFLRIFAPHTATSGAFLERNKSFPPNFLVYTSGRKWCMSGEYERAFHESVSQSGTFLGSGCRKRPMVPAPMTGCSTSENPPFYRWFEGGIVNSCYNALDYHVEHGLKDNTCTHLRQSGYKNRKTLYLWRTS